MPASSRRRSTGLEREAGPMAQTIEVLRAAAFNEGFPSAGEIMSSAERCWKPPRRTAVRRRCRSRAAAAAGSGSEPDVVARRSISWRVVR